MAIRIFANIKPEILIWARQSAGFSQEAVAASIKQTLDTILSWESGDSAPSIPQLRELATLYKRPLSVFYLQEVPMGFMVISDFRRTSPESPRKFSPELTQEIRIANQRRMLAKEMLTDIGSEESIAFNFSISIQDSPEQAGLKMREYFGLSTTEQPYRSDTSGRTGLTLWRELIEKAGVLVFQSIRIASEEASGFALAYPELPVIVINRKDAPVRRLFSLLHELAHLGLRKSGVSDLEVDSPRPLEDKALEAFCNGVAASALMPESIFKLDSVVLRHGQSITWDDAEIAHIAGKFGVSREAAVRRLLTLGLTNNDFYNTKREQYRQEHIEKKDQEKHSYVSAPIKRNMPQETLSNYGRRYIDLVFQNYYQDKLTLSEVSGYLGIRTNHVLALGHKLGASW
ncbi:XRE family transcriptional regulator [Methylotenera mobilis]|uniref:XRE family transcriptional regulator n=1 Tax=Methylotenera mobilis TaxID=359408 RepID=UPI00038226C6|nr:XRE family transcriptional regulator [Methylotenera mobilis]PPC97167.1 MAG: hypothetical protein CTY32_02785 [Methylotenera sp.]